MKYDSSKVCTDAKIGSFGEGFIIHYLVLNLVFIRPSFIVLAYRCLLL